MSRDAQRLDDYLSHVLAAIERIERYTDDIDELAFFAAGDDSGCGDPQSRNRRRGLPNIEVHCPEFAAAHPELPLAFAYQMRNAVAHGYFKVDLEVVWKTLQNDLTPLYEQVRTLRAGISNA